MKRSWLKGHSFLFVFYQPLSGHRKDTIGPFSPGISAVLSSDFGCGRVFFSLGLSPSFVYRAFSKLICWSAVASAVKEIRTREIQFRFALLPSSFVSLGTWKINIEQFIFMHCECLYVDNVAHLYSHRLDEDTYTTLPKLEICVRHGRDAQVISAHPSRLSLFLLQSFYLPAPTNARRQCPVYARLSSVVNIFLPGAGIIQ